MKKFFSMLSVPEFALIIVAVVVLLIILTSCIKIVPQAHAMIIERLGGYRGTWGVGLHWKWPFLDRIAKRINLKEQVVDFEPQPVITKIMLRCGLIRLYFSRLQTQRHLLMVWKIQSWRLKI